MRRSAARSSPSPDAALSAQGEITDVVLERGLSLHFFDEGVAVFCSRIESGSGYAQFGKRDLQVLIEFFQAEENRRLLDPTPPG